MHRNALLMPCRMGSDQDDAGPVTLQEKKDPKKKCVPRQPPASHRALRSGDLVLKGCKRSEVAGQHEAREKGQEKDHEREV